MAKYWFRKRRGLLSPDLGIGWVPISKEGWIVVAGYLAFIIINAMLIIRYVKNELTIGILMIVLIAVSIGAIIIICHKKTDNRRENEAH